MKKQNTTTNATETKKTTTRGAPTIVGGCEPAAVVEDAHAELAKLAYAFALITGEGESGLGFEEATQRQRVLAFNVALASAADHVDLLGRMLEAKVRQAKDGAS